MQCSHVVDSKKHKEVGLDTVIPCNKLTIRLSGLWSV